MTLAFCNCKLYLASDFITVTISSKAKFCLHENMGFAPNLLKKLLSAVRTLKNEKIVYLFVFERFLLHIIFWTAVVTGCLLIVTKIFSYNQLV